MHKIRVSLLFIGVFLIGIVAMSASEEWLVVVPGLALEEGDIAQFGTSELENLTISIDPASAQMSAMGVSNPNTGKTFTLSRVRVTAATVPYSRSQYAAHNPDRPTLHYLTNPQIEEVVGYRVAKKAAEFSLYSLAATPNDSAEAVGANYVQTEDFAVSDFAATTEASFNASAYLSWPQVEAKYQAYASDLAGNGSDADFVDSVSKEEKSTLHISTLDNFEESTLEVLKSNIAANYSTPGDIVTPDRVHILDYAYNASNPNATILESYVSDDFAERIRKELEDEDSSALAFINFKLFGIKLGSSVRKVSGFGSLFKKIGKTFKLGKVTVSTPLTKRVSSWTKNYKPPLVKAVHSAIKGEIPFGINNGRAVINSALSYSATAPKIATFPATEDKPTYTKSYSKPPVMVPMNQNGALARTTTSTDSSTTNKLTEKAVSTHTASEPTLLEKAQQYWYIFAMVGLLVAGVAGWYLLRRRKSPEQTEDIVTPY